MKHKYLRLILSLLLVFSIIMTPCTYQDTASAMDLQRTITHFNDEGKQIKTISFSLNQGLAELTEQMPNTISVVLDNDDVTDIEVEWKCLGDYESTDDYYYEFIPQWDESKYALSKKLDSKTDVPYIMAVEKSLSNKDIFGNTSTGSTQYSANANVSKIFSFLTNECNFNSAVACGILANIECESNFNPNLWGDNNTSYGICQWHNSRFATMQNWCNDNRYDWKTLEGQLHYLKKELSVNDSSYLYNGKTISNYLKTLSNTADDAYEAGRYWCYYYEVPAEKELVSVARGNNARNIYWPQFSKAMTVYTTANLNVRASANTSSKILGTLSKGTSVTVYGFNNGWYTIKYNNSTAYIYSVYTTVTQPAITNSVSDIFSDVSNRAWYNSAIQYVYDLGIMAGTSSSTFAPKSSCTRGMAVTILYNLSKTNRSLSIVSNKKVSFNDVKKGAWYYQAVQWAAANKIITGYGNKKFGPNDLITREQFAVMLYNYATVLNKNVSNRSTLSKFSDSSRISGYAKTAMQWIVADGIMTGSDGHLLPKNATSRAESAALIQQFAKAMS